MSPSKEPVTWANVVAAVVAFLSLGVAMGWWSITGDQFAEIERAIGAFGVFLAPIAAALWARLQVTPLAEPKDEDDHPLVRKGTQSETIKQTRSALKR